ncbi:MAG: SoxR reducing system RseC family protein [Planctomycetota bacterium]|jgi:hypothetical protein
MQGDDFCQGCNQKDSCQEAYRRLGSVRGPSILGKVVLAFLLPMLVFIGSLAVFQKIAAKAAMAEGAQTTLSFLLAAVATFVCVLVTRAIHKRTNEKQQHPDA